MQGKRLETLTWPEAEQALTEFEVVVLPLGARLKEHGHHLPLNNDWIMAEYLAERVIQRVPALFLPTLQYSYYPSFIEYPGSVHITEEASCQTIVDMVDSFSRHGCRKFYVLNTGVSTLKPLRGARERLAGTSEDVSLTFTDILAAHDGELTEKWIEQEGGTHADEHETSMMLYIAPEIVRMERAQKDYDGRGRGGPLRRDPDATDGVVSPTGVFGDPTLATVEKGKVFVEALVEFIVAEIETLLEAS